MPAMPQRQSRLVLAAAAAVALLAGCGSVSHGIASSVTPYKVEVVQGNFVSKEQVEALHPGMSRDQVRGVLGSPLVTSLFHADRWDYVFTLKRQGVAAQQRRLTVYFSGDAMQKVEGDTMPSEAEFVATLDRRKVGKAPNLEATEAQLRSFNGKTGAPPAAAASAPAATSANYPPLEPAAR